MSIAINIGRSELVARYELPDNELSIGSTLGGPRGSCIIKASGAIQTIFSTDLGLNLFGTIILRHFDRTTGMVLKQQKPGTFVIHPERQEHSFCLSNGLLVHEEIFVLGGSVDAASVSPPGVYLNVTITNPTSSAHDVQTYAFAQLRGMTDADVSANWEEPASGFVAWNAANQNQTRVFGSSEHPNSYQAATDAGMVVAMTSPGPLKNCAAAKGDPVAALCHEHSLNPQNSVSWYYLCSFGNGREEALQNYSACPQVEDALLQTKNYYQSVLQKAVVMTPNEMVNLGVLWAKANMVRVQNRAPTGWCFVNDPTRSNNSVGRDTAWFAFGADYVSSDFAHESLMAYVDKQEEDGLIVEYYDVRNGKTADYGLNINDNTPLIVISLWHHFNTNGNIDFLEKVYPAVRKAVAKILAERNDQGLVWCTADGTSDWGCVGWRNVITGYRLSGATTELNSECYAALRIASLMAKALGKTADADSFQTSAAKLKESINTHLLNPANGLYYLCIDIDGQPRTDVTSDLVFPVMYGVADRKISAAIISRLSAQDFWTVAGIRTSPRDAIDYDPAGLVNGPYGLMGGVWLGASFWFAFAAARFNQQFMVHALSASFRNFSIDPRRNNTVPGQFSEWLHGETIVNEGMMLSPWDAPRYLWAAVEGVGGLDLSGDELKCEPRLDPSWKWLGVRNVPYRGRSLSWLAVPGTGTTLYTNFPLASDVNHQVFDEDITGEIEATVENVCLLGFRNETEAIVFVGSTASNTIMTAVRCKCVQGSSVRVRRYDSLLGYWIDDGTIDTERLRAGYVLQIERQGCTILQLTKVG